MIASGSVELPSAAFKVGNGASLNTSLLLQDEVQPGRSLPISINLVWGASELTQRHKSTTHCKSAFCHATSHENGRGSLATFAGVISDGQTYLPELRLDGADIMTYSTFGESCI
jgi:hypothetical protein